MGHTNVKFPISGCVYHSEASGIQIEIFLFKIHLETECDNADHLEFFTVSSISVSAISSPDSGVSLSLSLSGSLLNGPLAETPDSAADIRRTTPWVKSNSGSNSPDTAWLSRSLLDGPLAETPDGAADVRGATPWVKSNSVSGSPDTAWLGLSGPLASASPAGGLESVAVSTWPGVLASVVAEAGVSNSCCDEECNNLEIPIDIFMY